MLVKLVLSIWYFMLVKGSAFNNLVVAQGFPILSLLVLSIHPRLVSRWLAQSLQDAVLIVVQARRELGSSWHVVLDLR